MSNRNFYWILICFLLLASCNSKNNPMAKTWVYNDQQEVHQVRENDSLYNAREDYSLSGSNFIDLQSDSSYTAYISGYDYGKWYFKEKDLILVSHSRKIKEWHVEKNDDDELVCFDRSKKNLIYRFKGYTNQFKDQLDNPFSRVNNSWRVKAAKKESDKEIEARLKNHFRYWEKYFAWGQSKNVKYLDVANTPGILDVYGNGFKMFYYDEQSPEWKNIFYDTADSWKAYEKVYYRFTAWEIKWPETDNRFKSMKSAFKQLQEWMDKKPLIEAGPK